MSILFDAKSFSSDKRGANDQRGSAGAVKIIVIRRVNEFHAITDDS